jgi:nucleoside-diphosphate-sugar epimerase
MRILLIGGNGFIGRFAVAALKQQGHALAVFHRGTAAVPAGVEDIRAVAASGLDVTRALPSHRNRLGTSCARWSELITDSLWVELLLHFAILEARF